MKNILGEKFVKIENEYKSEIKKIKDDSSASLKVLADTGEDLVRNGNSFREKLLSAIKLEEELSESLDESLKEHSTRYMKFLNKLKNKGVK